MRTESAGQRWGDERLIIFRDIVQQGKKKKLRMIGFFIVSERR
jgi:hypothetical protein